MAAIGRGMAGICDELDGMTSGGIIFRPVEKGKSRRATRASANTTHCAARLGFAPFVTAQAGLFKFCRCEWRLIYIKHELVSPPNTAQRWAVRLVHGKNFSQSVFRKIVINYLAES
jgi:hypothetical protein